ncbi:MAG: hypothetical protein CVU41_15090 [Chloroflexi bacterium HGW-Chloroflexi-3]|nr:MAG: hypothetical protein CVU41_15090 [Chloroflexi bacterium HGW-Chloroflexi-3]
MLGNFHAKKYYSKHRDSVLDEFVNCENFAVMNGFYHPSEQKSMGCDLFISPVTKSTRGNKYISFFSFSPIY